MVFGRPRPSAISLGRGLARFLFQLGMGTNKASWGGRVVAQGVELRRYNNGLEAGVSPSERVFETVLRSCRELSMGEAYPPRG